MRLWILPVLLLFISTHIFADNYVDTSDNDFAEFEDEEFVDSKLEEVVVEEIKETEFIEDEDDVQVDDDNEFEHFEDHEEFEGYQSKEDEVKPKTDKEPEIKIVEVPQHVRQNWESYYLEILMISGLFIYFINFITGKSKNNKIANTWFEKHKQLLEENFALVGDDTNLDKNETPGLYKESENVYNLWCSGRICCEGMLVELKLIKRQDINAIISGIMRPTVDQINIQVKMNKEDMDTFVFCVAAKKTALHFSKDIADISLFCPERKSGDKFNLPVNFQVMGEIAEATSAMLDSKVTAILNKYPDLVEYIHISDQYTGAKQTEDQAPLKLPETEKMLLFGFNMPMKGITLEEAVARTTPLMNMVFYLIDKMKRYRLSKEGN